MIDDVLFTIAELSIALAGFSGIVVAVSDKRSQTWDVRNLLVSMIFLSLIVAASSLFPSVVSLYGPENLSSWRIHNGLLALAMILYFSYAFLRTQRGVRARAPGAPVRIAMRILGVSAAAVYLLVALANVLAASSVIAAGSAVYATSLFALLFVAGTFFLAAFLRISGRKDGEHIT